MDILSVGLNHKTAPVEVREQVAFNSENSPCALLQLKERVPGVETVIVSTCNRVEIYAAAPGIERSSDGIGRFLGDFHGIDPEAFLPHLYHRYDRDAVRHMFMVACSLDSMVVGEAEILGQVKQAYTFALEEGVSGKVLNHLFQCAFRAAKKVRTSSSIGTGKVSIASVAVEFAEKIFGNFSNKTVMIIGAGEMGELTLKHMVDKGIGAVMVANRTYTKATELAEQYDGIAIKYDSFVDNMHQADVIISTSGAPHHIIQPNHLHGALRDRRSKPMLLVDIAVPRDIHPDVDDIENVYLYNIDDLRRVVDENIACRQKELEHCASIIDAETDAFMGWLQTIDVDGTIREFRKTLHEIRQAEVNRLLKKLPHLDGRQRREVEYLAERIVNKILNEPVQVLKKKASHGDEFRHLDTLKTLFGLK